MDAEGRIRDELQADPLVAFALLFGSRASGRPRADSDWDIGVGFDPSTTAQQRFQRRLQLTAALEPEIRVDLVVLDDAPPILAHRALGGRRLFVRDPVAWVRFFVRTLALVEDERHYARVHEAARRRRLEEGNFGRP